MSSKLPQTPVRFGVEMSKPFKWWAFGAILSVFTATLLGRLMLVIIRNLTDAIAAPQLDFQTIWFWAILFPLAQLVVSNVWRMSGFMGMRWFTSSRAYAYNRLYDYLTRHNKEYFNSRFAGALANKVSNAVDGSEAIFTRTLWKFYPLFLGILINIILVGYDSAMLAVIILVWTMFFVVVNILFARTLHPYSYRSAKAYSVLKGTIIDSLSNISIVHEYAHLKEEKAYIQQYIDVSRVRSLVQWWKSEWILVMNGFLIFLFVAMMLLTSIYLLQIGLISVGVIIMVLSIVRDMTSDLFFMGQEVNGAAREYGQAKEGLQEIVTQHKIVDDADAKRVNLKKGGIKIVNMSFQYDSDYVFRNFSLSIKPGEKVGIVGKSGAGKSTLVSLLLRHFDVQDGDILIDDHSIRKITLNSLRRGIAFVPQDTSMFHRTILENIRYSKPKAKEAEVKKAARQALAHQFIENLPEKYDTLVGERGVKLSGGQRQRVAIARAFLKDSPILILDEATSSLDSESEEAIQKSLDTLMKNRTVIAIAHRLSTLKKMDRIVILEGGKIVEDGTPDELMKIKNGVFKSLWDHQVKGFILDEEN